MTVLGWTLIGLGYALLGYWAMVWIRQNTRVPIPGRAQDVRAICRRQAQLDVDYAVEQALKSARLKTSAGSRGPA